MELAVDSENYRRERERGLVALWLSIVIPAVYVVKNLIFKLDIKTWMDGNEHSNTTRVYLDKFEPLLQGSYVNSAAIIELCVCTLALIDISCESLQRAVLLVPYIICTFTWCASIGGYLLLFIIWKKPHPVNAIMILCCALIYAVILLHAYFARMVLKLCLALNEVRRNSVSTKTKTAKDDLVEIPLPKSHIDSSDKCERRSCPSVMYSDLLRKYEPYFPDVDDQDEHTIYTSSLFVKS